MKHNKCLILGGFGFIGIPTVKRLIASGIHVKMLRRDPITSFDHDSKKNYNYEVFNDQEKESIEIIKGDFQDIHALDEALDGCNLCVHLITTTIPQSSNKDIYYDINSNLIGSIRFIEAANNHRIKKIVYLSSGGTVYGNPLYTPINELHPTDPICSYGITKLSTEKYIRMFNMLHENKSVILRLSNPYGPGSDRSRLKGAIGTFVELALSNGDISIFGTGATVRDYIYIDDAIESIISSIAYTGDESVFNIGSGVGTSLNEIILIIEKIMNKKLSVKYLPTRKTDVFENILDINKAANHLNWLPKTSLYDGIMKYIYFKLKNTL